MKLRPPDDIAVWIDTGSAGARRQDSAARITCSLDGAGLDVALEADSDGLLQIVLRWEESFAAGCRILGDHWERGYGDLEWRGMVPERILPWYALVHHLDGGTEGFGVETGGAAIASWRVDPAGVSLVLDLRCGTEGVVLKGRKLGVSRVIMHESRDPETPFAFTQRFCRAMCPAPRLPKFPVYGGNDWYYAYGKNSDASIRRDAALIRELSPSTTNAPFMVIDAGWFPSEGCSGGPYAQGNEKFPDMPGLAAAMHEMEVRPGIWIRPLLTSDAPAEWKLPPGHPIHASEAGSFLDPSRPEVLARVKEDIARLSGWGYELIKHDFTTFDVTGRWGFQMGDGLLTSGSWQFADTGRTTAEIIRDLYRAIREAAGEALLIGCNTIGHLGAGLFELQRTGDDTSGHEWERTRKMGVNTLSHRMPQHRAFFDVDADCVGLTRQVPWELNRQWLDVLARSGSPLFVSADPEAVGPEQRSALQEAFTLAAEVQPIAEPLDWLETTCPSEWRSGSETRTYRWMPTLDQSAANSAEFQRS